ncbi:MAG: leucyl/phenylalanyl-tRNA--protein transferase [Planctomycetota bacterium]|nr:MAG: leucyl/phenylalanyl-tRNA--protein transferase [Planctomycetota bacterium]
MIYLEPDSPLFFPDPRFAVDPGIVAVGGDLSRKRLLLAYRIGVFPWYSENELPLWWCPDPRAVLPRESLHVSRSLRRRISRGGFELSWNRAFRRVVEECRLEREDGRWIHDEVLEAYCELHEAGHGHSLEVWEDGELSAGIYGVQVGGLFAAESKFHRRRDASKIALVACVHTVFAAGIMLFDVQMQTEHLARLGVEEWPRQRYLDQLEDATQREVSLADPELRLDLNG